MGSEYNAFPIEIREAKTMSTAASDSDLAQLSRDIQSLNARPLCAAREKLGYWHEEDPANSAGTTTKL